MQRNTSQKSAVLEYLQGVKSHPSAETVYEEVKKKMPGISKGTVYRILNKYRDNGDIREIKTDVSRYDADISHHSHFVCRQCGRVYDLFDFPSDLKINKKTKVGIIDNYQIYLYGVCRKCELDKR